MDGGTHTQWSFGTCMCFRRTICSYFSGLNIVVGCRVCMQLASGRVLEISEKERTAQILCLYTVSLDFNGSPYTS
jgi:hypothetical protein